LRFIDLSCPVEDNPSEPSPIKVKELPHEGANRLGLMIILSRRHSLKKNIKNVLGYLDGSRRLTKNSFPDGEFINQETVTLSVHTGTHLDAPAHFGLKCERKAPKTIDEIPLEWCFGDGVVLDMRHKKGGEFITVPDVKEALAKIDYTIKPMDIVLIHTGTDKKWGTPRYFFDAPGMSREATEFIVEQGVKIIGIDSYGFDRPFFAMIEDYFRTKDSKVLWPAHVYGRTREYCHIERLANLDQLPSPTGFKISCFPIKLTNLGAGWIRAVALVDGDDEKEKA